MTRILLFVEIPKPTHAWYDDPRAKREIMQMVNLGRLRYGDEREPRDDRRQSASIVNPFDQVAVTFYEPLVPLSERMYTALFALADGCNTRQVAALLDCSEGRAADLLEEIRSRFGAWSLYDAIASAQELGLV